MFNQPFTQELGQVSFVVLMINEILPDLGKRCVSITNDLFLIGFFLLVLLLLVVDLINELTI